MTVEHEAGLGYRVGATGPGWWWMEPPSGPEWKGQAPAGEELRLAVAAAWVHRQDHEAAKSDPEALLMLDHALRKHDFSQTCPLCGFGAYVTSSAEDRRAHKRAHARALEALADGFQIMLDVEGRKSEAWARHAAAKTDGVAFSALLDVARCHYQRSFQRALRHSGWRKHPNLARYLRAYSLHKGRKGATTWEQTISHEPSKRMPQGSSWWEH